MVVKCYQDLASMITDSSNSKTKHVSQLGDFFTCSRVWTFNTPKQSDKTKNTLIDHIEDEHWIKKMLPWGNIYSRDRFWKTDEQRSFTFVTPSPNWLPTNKGSNLPKSRIPRVKWRGSAKTPKNWICRDLSLLNSTRIPFPIMTNNNKKPHIHLAVHLFFEKTSCIIFFVAHLEVPNKPHVNQPAHLRQFPSWILLVSKIQNNANSCWWRQSLFGAWRYQIL